MRFWKDMSIEIEPIDVNGKIVYGGQHETLSIRTDYQSNQIEIIGNPRHPTEQKFYERGDEMKQLRFPRVFLDELIFALVRVKKYTKERIKENEKGMNEKMEKKRLELQAKIDELQSEMDGL